MAASNETMANIINQLVYMDTEMTVVEMAKAFNVSVATIRSAVTFGSYTKQVVKIPNSYPHKYKGFAVPIEPGSTVIIGNKPIAPLELSAGMMGNIKAVLMAGRTPDNASGLIYEAYYKVKINPKQREEFRVFLINFAHVIKEVIENETELHPDDLKL